MTQTSLAVNFAAAAAAPARPGVPRPLFIIYLRRALSLCPPPPRRSACRVCVHCIEFPAEPPHTLCTIPSRWPAGGAGCSGRPCIRRRQILFYARNETLYDIIVFGVCHAGAADGRVEWHSTPPPSRFSLLILLHNCSRFHYGKRLPPGRVNRTRRHRAAQTKAAAVWTRKPTTEAAAAWLLARVDDGFYGGGGGGIGMYGILFKLIVRRFLIKLIDRHRFSIKSLLHCVFIIRFNHITMCYCSVSSYITV